MWCECQCDNSPSKITTYKSKPLKVNVWPSTRSLGSHRITISYQGEQKLRESHGLQTKHIININYLNDKKEH